MSQPEHRIAAIETALVSLPLDRPVITPIHRIPAVDCVLVTLRTDSGLQGIAYLWCFGAMRARALAALVEDMFAVVHGRDALAGETAWRAMWNEANFLGRTGAVMFALSAIDTALWDIRGKAADLPLWRLLGGERRKVPVYAGGLFLSDPIDAIVAEAKRYVAAGFGAMKMRTGAKTASEDIARVEARSPASICSGSRIPCCSTTMRGSPPSRQPSTYRSRQARTTMVVAASAAW